MRFGGHKDDVEYRMINQFTLQKQKYPNHQRISPESVPVYVFDPYMKTSMNLKNRISHPFLFWWNPSSKCLVGKDLVEK